MFVFGSTTFFGLAFRKQRARLVTVLIFAEVIVTSAVTFFILMPHSRDFWPWLLGTLIVMGALLLPLSFLSYRLLFSKRVRDFFEEESNAQPDSAEFLPPPPPTFEA